MLGCLFSGLLVAEHELWMLEIIVNFTVKLLSTLSNFNTT